MTHAAEHRNFGRIKLEINGSVAVGEELPAPCLTRDISYCGALITTEAVGRIGAKAILSLSDACSLQSRIVRVLPGGFAVEFLRQVSSTEMLQMLTQHCKAKG